MDRSKMRCPYCITAHGFRKLTEKITGEFVCSSCGHSARSDIEEFQCPCPRCRSMTIYIERASRPYFALRQDGCPIATSHSDCRKRSLS